MRRGRPRQLASGFLLSACLAAPVAGASMQGEPEPMQKGEAAEVREASPSVELLRVAGIVRRARSGGEACAAVVEELSAQRDVLVPSALELLTRRRVPAVEEGQDAQTLNRYQQQALLDALDRLPREAIALALAAWRVEEPGVEERVTEIRVRGAVGDVDDLAALLDLAWRKADHGLDRRLDDALGDAVTSLAQRDARALDWLRERHATLPDALRPTLVLAVGAAGDARAVGFLAQVAHWHPELVGAVAGQVVALGPSPAADVNRELCDVMIEHLAQDDPAARSSIALALGSLGVPDSVPELIGLLGSEALGVRANALAALREITGLGFPETPALWSTWYRSEGEWYRKQAPGLWRDLESRQLGRPEAALRALSQRRLHRHEIAERVSRLLAHASSAASPDVRVLACATLVKLDSPVCLAALVDGLQDRDEGVRRAAWEALVELTGSELPPEADAWLALVGG